MKRIRSPTHSLRTPSSIESLLAFNLSTLDWDRSVRHSLLTYDYIAMLTYKLLKFGFGSKTVDLYSVTFAEQALAYSLNLGECTLVCRWSMLTYSVSLR